jgi:hypothetical protein
MSCWFCQKDSSDPITYVIIKLKRSNREIVKFTTTQTTYRDSIDRTSVALPCHDNCKNIADNIENDIDLYKVGGFLFSIVLTGIFWIYLKYFNSGFANSISKSISGITGQNDPNNYSVVVVCSGLLLAICFVVYFHILEKIKVNNVGLQNCRASNYPEIKNLLQTGFSIDNSKQS